ncbi:hypothetical protein P389DRAFT_197805 [Cystobasidium minutum MCA 4210]|uniref:uncharacterized protein n=1 Tax=Cystobasidium minutum MCA 4210 TaxID=1397322 RepID=UPI0034CDC526|eukprot:jgi/Rhomi1/197805/gm1.6019_g
MQQASPRHLSIFHKLPEEIIVQILSFTDARTVGRFTACSSSCRAIVEHSSQIIYEALAIRHFTALTPCTAGDSGITIDALPDFLLDCGRGEDEEVASRTVAPVELDLRRAIVCQRTSSTAYDDVRTWKDFVKRRTLVDHAWRHERPSRYPVSQCPDAGDLIFGFWRFKVCSITRKVISSTPVVPNMGLGVLMCSDRSSEPRAQSFIKSTRGWTHVEYSNGHLVFIDQSTIEVHVNEPSTNSFRHKHSIAPPSRLISYKARYPYLITLSGTSAKAYLFDIEQGKLAREYNLTGDPEPAYVELDQWSLFLAGSALTIINRNSGTMHKMLDTSLEDPRDETWTTRWSAVHHSLDGRHLVVVGDANELVWIRDYRSLLTDSEEGVDYQKLAQQAVILRLEEDPGEVLIENLCVENDRVVFTTQSVFFPVVYLFELCDWTDFSDFRARAPQLRILTGALPVGHDGISRVEMDSTSIYLTASTRQIFKDTPRFEDIHPSDLELAWYKLDGTRLCDAHVRPTWPPSSPAQKHDMRKFDAQSRVFLNDAILCYDFSKPCQEDAGDNDSDSMFEPENLEDLLPHDWATGADEP